MIFSTIKEINTKRMKFIKGSHSIYRTEYHLVWIPKYRRKIFVKGVKEYADKLLQHISELSPDILVKKVNVRVDHVHMILVIPPKLAVSRVVQFIKSQSAKILKEKFSYLKKVYYGVKGIWSRGYCISTIGLNEKEILKYVEHQEKEDNGQLQLDL